MKRLLLTTLTLSFLFAQTACMKTRSQIKQDESADQTDAVVDNGQGATPKNGSRYELDEIRDELTRVSGRVDDLDHRQQAQSSDDLKGYVTRIDARVSDLEKNQLLVMSELKALKDKESSDEQAAKEAATPPIDLVAAGNQLLARKNFDQAAEKFHMVVNKSRKGKEAAAAFYGLGEVEYQQKNYKKAIVQYSAVQEASAKSSLVPSSLYRIGLSFRHLNMPKEAQEFFKDLLDRFPRSAEAKKARAKVKE